MHYNELAEEAVKRGADPERVAKLLTEIETPILHMLGKENRLDQVRRRESAKKILEQLASSPEESSLSIGSTSLPYNKKSPQNFFRDVVLPVYTMNEKDLEKAALEGVWYPICPHCKASTPAEPDADKIYCQSCDREFRISNPYF